MFVIYHFVMSQHVYIWQSIISISGLNFSA